MRIGIFSGSFDPIHTGHAMIASYMAQWTDLDELWLMVSRLNPFKAGTNPAEGWQRYEMAELVASKCKDVYASDFELKLPLPSYSYRTLVKLRDNYPDNKFVLIIGSDNWSGFKNWKNAENILNEFELYIYQRPGYEIDKESLPPNAQLIEGTPQSLISSTFVRKALKENKNLNFFIPEEVLKYIEQHQLYRND